MGPVHKDRDPIFSTAGEIYFAVFKNNNMCITRIFCGTVSIFLYLTAPMANAMIMKDMSGDNSVELAQSSYSDVGAPLAQIYTTKQHGGHNQNWTTIQSSDGLVYVGHTQGISQWDGEHWHNFVTPHSTPVRSISQFKDDLYFGTTNDVFKLTINPAGELKATSLLDSLSDSGKSFGEIW